jgi:hypothetical protein
MTSSEPGTSSEIDLPSFIDGDFEVYVNGILQEYEGDYRLNGRTLVFSRSLAAEVKMSPVQWVLVAVGVGNYAKFDTVDIVYERDGRKLVATGLRPRPDS